MKKSHKNQQHNKVIVFCFGGFRIISKAHEHLIHVTLDTAKNLHCDCDIWISSSKGKYLALTPKQKLEYLSSCILPGQRKMLRLTDIQTKFPYLVVQKYIELGYEKIIFVAGSDREYLAEQIKNQIIASNATIDFVFQCIERENDISATVMKYLVYANDENAFCDYAPKSLEHWQKIKMFGDVALGIGHWNKKSIHFTKRIEYLKQIDSNRG